MHAPNPRCLFGHVPFASKPPTAAADPDTPTPDLVGLCMAAVALELPSLQQCWAVRADLI